MRLVITVALALAAAARDNARLMSAAGLALLAPTPASLTSTVGRLADDPTAVAALAQAACARATFRCREDDLTDLAVAAPR